MTAAASGIGGVLASRAACDVIEGFPNISPNMEEENEQQTPTTKGHCYSTELHCSGAKVWDVGLPRLSSMRDSKISSRLREHLCVLKRRASFGICALASSEACCSLKRPTYSNS